MSSTDMSHADRTQADALCLRYIVHRTRTADEERKNFAEAVRVFRTLTRLIALAQDALDNSPPAWRQQDGLAISRRLLLEDRLYIAKKLRAVMLEKDNARQVLLFGGIAIEPLADAVAVYLNEKVLSPQMAARLRALEATP
jgi:hypothetical protein